ncbi:DUF3443 domain-containing protein [Bdellovibrio sp. SKB1291214]|uniref:DUF3443 family protein n=1 Tax=Bdellovibrio sp. SKB1291214 TaxID=1732569 RepID=UPI000B517EDF|nr:DUF3443 family protein [Bdellovibrio sp. SKB1291214]UYL08406.1 DUF3443 domain-containing protein [Bdellovibrio sp. SKB1291214]
MNSIKSILILLGILIVGVNQVGCNGSTVGSKTLAASVYYPTALSGDNVIPMSVGACGVDGYANEPCISVTICTPGTSNCQTIDNILVDTGSYGLKIFKSLISVPLTQVDMGNGYGLASCTGYLDGSGHWGQVVKADVKLGNLSTATNNPSGISIVTLDSKYSNASGCSSSPDKDPSEAGFNGIIGVGSFVEDCSVGYAGANGCTLTATRKYWKCTAVSCSMTTVAAADQIANPVAKMPTGYDNGLVLKLPSVSSTGAGAAYGYMILGIGTDAYNSPTGVTVFPVENDATFVTRFNNRDYEYAFIDSGTNFNGFPRVGGNPALCSGSTDFFCPATETTITATMKSGSVTQAVSFKVGNMITLASATPYSMVYSNIAFNTADMGETGSPSDADVPFDWGLPFFLGRSVYVGIKGTSATINGQTVSGPHWAF